MSLQSALLGYLMARLIPSISPLTPRENVVLQTTATATGTMPLAAGFVGIIPALSLLDKRVDGSEPVVLSWLGSIAWSCSIAYFGVFLAAPLRKQVVSSSLRHYKSSAKSKFQIIKEKLVFPSGTATAQLIAVMHNQPPPKTEGTASLRRRAPPEGYSRLESDEEHERPSNEVDPAEHTPEAPKQPGQISNGWHLLGWSFTASGSLTLLAYFFPIVFSVPLFGKYLAREWLWTFSPSLSYVGQGIIMGFPTTLSMNLGMIAGWAILSPIAKNNGWAPGPVGSMDIGARGWILWIALAVMCAESVVSLVPFAFEFARDLTKASVAFWRPGTSLNGDTLTNNGHDEDPETEDRLVPTPWILWGMGASVVFGTFMVWLVFGSTGIKPWATVLSFMIGTVLGLLGVRALGETDLNPVSGLGKLAQLAFAFLQPGNVVANIIAGGVAEAGAQQAGDLMQDLKTGHLLHASPRAQFYGQLIGSSLSIFVSATAYQLYTRAYTIPSPNFPAPTAYVWLSLARLLRDGSLPPKTSDFMLWFGLAAVCVAIAKVRATAIDSPWARWIPSGVAFAIGFLNTPNFSMARLIGGVIELWYSFRQRKRHAAGKGSDGIAIIIVASGFVLGELELAVGGRPPSNRTRWSPKMESVASSSVSIPRSLDIPPILPLNVEPKRNRTTTNTMSHYGRERDRDDQHSVVSRPHSRATSVSRKSTASRNQSLIKKNTAPSDLRPSDVLIERFIAWKAITKQLIAYFQGIADIENNTGRELTKLGAVIQVPFRAGNQFLGEGGLQDIFYNVRDRTRAIADQHTSLARTIDSSLVQHLEKLLLEIKAHIRNIQNDTGKLATSVAKERELSTKHIADLAKSIAMFKNTPMSIQARDDPFCQNLLVTKQLVKQVNEENALQKSIILMQQNSAHFEEGIVRSIQSAWQTFDEWQARMSAAVQETWRGLGESMASLAPDREWIAFSARSDHLLDPDTPLRNPETIEYPSKEDPSVVPLHTGMMERKRRYTRSYRESYFVLTAAGFLHQYDTADPVEQTHPSFSLFLPSCTLGPPSSPTTDRSHKFHIEGRKDATGLSRSNSILHRGSQAWTFRARSHDEMLEWWNDIRMLVARYLVASDQMERSGPVAAAVRQAGYVSEEEVSEQEDGSSLDAAEGEDNDGHYIMHQGNGVNGHHDEPVPSYSQPRGDSSIRLGEYGYAVEKKDSPGQDSGGDLSRRTSRRTDKAPARGPPSDEGESHPVLPQTPQNNAHSLPAIAEGDPGVVRRPSPKAISSDEPGPAPSEPESPTADATSAHSIGDGTGDGSGSASGHEEDAKGSIVSKFMGMLH
ncbi:hypothetical protein FRB99_007108 [Tulasnella sp. 403]|nr:hypothetical protein FRB99_007108 [Tulasnella sp. 403]